MRIIILMMLVVFMISVSVEAKVIERNVQTGEVIEREYTQQELDNIAEANARELPQRQKKEALHAKKQADIAALGTRAELLAEIDKMTGASPQVKAMMKKLAEVIYSNGKGTVN